MGDSVRREYDSFILFKKEKEWHRSLRIKDLISSVPPLGHLRIVNMYIDANSEKLVVEYEDTPVEEGDYI